MIPRRALLAAAAAPSLAPPARAQAGTVKLGVLNDRSGVYRDISGHTSVACVRRAVEDGAPGFPVEVPAGDHQNKPDISASIARMKARPTDDDAFGAGSTRADGRKLHPVCLFEVKKPGESKAPWDYDKLIATTPAEQAFRPLNEGGCPLVRA